MQEVQLNARTSAKLVELNRMKNEAQNEISKMVTTLLDSQDIDYTGKKVTLSEDNSTIIIEEIETKED
jgi:oligoendopeptidase F